MADDTEMQTMSLPPVDGPTAEERWALANNEEWQHIVMQALISWAVNYAQQVQAGVSYDPNGWCGSALNDPLTQMTIYSRAIAFMDDAVADWFADPLPAIDPNDLRTRILEAQNILSQKYLYG